MGASDVINYRDNPQWGDKVLALTGGRGADIVVEVGGPEHPAPIDPRLPRGRSHRADGRADRLRGDIPTVELMRKQQSPAGPDRGQPQRPAGHGTRARTIRLKPVIDSQYPLEQIAAAFEHQKAGRHFGKVCLSFDHLISTPGSSSMPSRCSSSP